MLFSIMKLTIIQVILIDSMWGLILGLNYLSYSMTLLTALILPICLLTTRSLIMENFIFILGLILFVAFSTHNLLIWYISFEAVLIPMIYLISKGSSSLLSRYRALYRFTLYTIGGGLLLLSSLILIVINVGSYDYYSLIFNQSISNGLSLILFPLIFIAYAIKLPLIPFHIWLPDTHGEAPTAASVILAALLLKLGGVGILRWLIPILSNAYLYYRPLLIIIGVLSTIYASITTLRHLDAKKLIAYSSISHMGLIVVGMVSPHLISYKGIIYLLISHGLVSSLLFLLIGSLYVRTSTRSIIYHRGLASTMPIFSIFFFFALLLNASLPPSLSFIAELNIITGTFPYELIGIIHVLIALFLSGVYSLMLFSRIIFSTLPYSNTHKDLTLREFIIVLPLPILSFLLSFIL